MKKKPGYSWDLVIVKPWSKSESKPLSQQAPKLNKSPPKKGKKKDLGLTLKSQVAKYHKVSMRCPKFFHPKPKYLREFMRGVQVRV